MIICSDRNNFSWNKQGTPSSTLMLKFVKLYSRPGSRASVSLVDSQDDTLLLTQNKSPMKLNQSINKILENITEGEVKEDEVGHGVIESDDEEEEDTRDQLKVSKKRKGRLLSDSEESDTEETEKPDEDMDDGSNNADEGEKDYDSEENEVVKPAKAKQKLFDKKGKLRRDFYDVEAELSDEEDGRADVSDDEDEKGLDRFEMEEGDLDEIDEDAERAKVKNMSEAKAYIQGWNSVLIFYKCTY